MKRERKDVSVAAEGCSYRKGRLVQQGDLDTIGWRTQVGRKDVLGLLDGKSVTWSNIALSWEGIFQG